MGARTLAFWKLVCRNCRLVTNYYRGVATVSGPSNRAVPLRIFTTENLGNQDYPNLEISKYGLPTDEKEKRYQEWLQKRLAQAPPDERLSRELKMRVGKSRPRGLKRAVDLLTSSSENKVITRTRSRRHTVPTMQIDPSELMQSPKAEDSGDTIYSAIENCIAAAIDRLELYHHQQDIRDLANNPISIPHDQYMWLSSILQFQFSKQQLVDYGAKTRLKRSQLQNCKTADTIGQILEKIWNLEKEPELPPEEALVTKSICPLATGLTP